MQAGAVETDVLEHNFRGHTNVFRAREKQTMLGTVYALDWMSHQILVQMQEMRIKIPINSPLGDFSDYAVLSYQTFLT